MIWLLSSVLVAATPAVSEPPLIAADVPLPAAETAPHLALMFDAGAPDGLGASLMLRPASWLRLYAGALTNGASAGLRGGITIATFHALATPTLTLEAGHLRDGNANPLASYLARDASFHADVLDHVGYDFVNAQLGVELGPPDRWVFWCRAGVSWIRASPTLAEAVNGAVGQATSGLVSANLGTIWMPSVKVGLTLYVL